MDKGPFDDFFALLNCSFSSSPSQISTEYKILALKYHPDKPTGDEKMFKRICEAYNVLSDPDERKLYDKYYSSSLLIPYKQWKQLQIDKLSHTFHWKTDNHHKRSLKNETDADDLYEKFRNYQSISAYIASSCGVIAGYPFDSMKTRMQTHKYASLRSCISDTFIHEGLVGFYRGVSAPLITTPILKSCAFTVYEYLKRRFSMYYNNDTSNLPVSLHFAAGALGGISIGLVSSPLDLLKIQLQLHVLTKRELGSIGTTVNPPSTSVLYRISHKVSENGFLSIYRGLSAVLIRESLGFGTYFGAYEAICRYVSPSGNKADVGSFTHFMAGGISGIFIWLVIFPFDLVQSRLQKEALSPTRAYAGVSDCIKKTFVESGVWGFYSGIMPSLIRAFPVHAIIFVVYESLLKFYQ